MLAPVSATVRRISRRISANGVLGTATSASWNVGVPAVAYDLNELLSQSRRRPMLHNFSP
jgi:hypothetical protein